MRRITLTGVFCFLSLLSLLIPAPVSAQGREFRKMVDFQSGGQLTVRTDLGSVRLTGGDQNQIEIYARIEPPKDAEASYATRAVEAAKIEVTGDSRSLTIRSHFDDVPTIEFNSKRLPNIHYEIRAPRQLNLDLNADRCKVDAAGLSGRIKLNTDRTTVALRDLSGEIDVRMDRGEATLSDLQGSISLHSDRTNSQIEAVRIDKDSKLDIGRGDCELRLPESQGLTLRGSVGRREKFESDFAVATTNFDKDRVEGTINGGGPQLIINTDRSTVRLKRK
jgi:hypothetical protein